MGPESVGCPQIDECRSKGETTHQRAHAHSHQVVDWQAHCLPPRTPNKIKDGLTRVKPCRITLALCVFAPGGRGGVCGGG